MNQKQFIDYLVSLAEPGETPLIVRQKIVKKDGFPDGQVWVPYMPGKKIPSNWAVYGNTASFIENRLNERKLSASSANCEYVLVMVLDDIGTKSKTPPIEPTWIMETSPNNYQYGYTFSEQPTKAEFTAAIRAIADAGYTDSGATNPVRNFRIPGSINLKAGRENFSSRLVEFHPEREFLLADICKALEVIPVETGSSQVRPIRLDTPTDDPIVKWLGENGLLLSPVNSEGWCAVICPNYEQHTNQEDITARYHPQDRAFCCYHAHCDHVTSQAFLDWVAENGGPAVTYGVDENLLKKTLQPALARLTASSMFTNDIDAVVAEIEQKNLGRVTKSEWYKRFAYILDEDAYFDMDYRGIVARRAFNALYRHIECRSNHGKHPKIEASFCYDENREVNGATATKAITYAAGESVIVSRQGELYCNRWRDARPEVDKTLKANIDPWLEHLARLVPDEEEREHVLDVMAFKVQNPKRKINHAVLHVGREGCGKDTLWAPMIWAVCGPHLRNRGLVDGKNINSDFGYALESEIIILNELKEPNASDRRALANQLKPIIAAPPDTISINKKNLHPYDMINRVFVLAFSNDPVPITLASQDRRWFCIRSTAARMPEEQSAAMWAWYNSGGFEAIAAFLYQRDVSAFNPAAPPMDTDYKASLIEGGMSTAEAYLVDMITRRKGEFASGVVGAPFVGLCDRLSTNAPAGTKIVQSVLYHALEEAGWIDMGRMKSAQYPSRKQIYADPDIVEKKTKSEIRNLVEDPYMPKVVKIARGA